MKLDWCRNQKQGIRCIEPNDNLALEYIRNAEESLAVFDKIKETQSKMWLATTKYYIEYFAFYALLMKIGVKCEIHDCTIEISRLLEKQKKIPRGRTLGLKRIKDYGLTINIISKTGMYRMILKRCGHLIC